jgi:dihydrolipoamide dehydrogenase
MEEFDIVVVGGGPAGYVAAIRAAQKGFKAACIEMRSTLGGTCLNVGCIPSKALLHSTEYYHKLHVEGKEHGILCEQLKVDLQAMMARKQKVVGSLTQGIAYLFKKHKVTSLTGKATFLNAHTLQVSTEQGSKEISAKNIILATGSEPIQLPFLPFDEKVVLSSTGALALEKVPKKMLIVGAGIIGLELGSVYRRLGAEIEVVELLDRAVPTLDAEVSKEVSSFLKKLGMVFHFSTRVLDAKIGAQSVALTVEDASGKKSVMQGDVVLVAVGRKPFTEGLDLDKVGIKKDSRGGVSIDHNFQTSCPHVYAVGDLVDGPMLAHKASEEAVAVVDMLAGEQAHINYLAIPNVMYTWPEVATVGMTEEEAKTNGLEIIIGKAPFMANARARCSGDSEGFVKVIGEKKTDRLIGVHIVGPSASEMIGEGVLALEKKATVQELAAASHAHPTCSESIKEAALACHKAAIHF